MWLAVFPLRERLAWAWWAFLVSGVVGFASFLAYIGYGYLDVWHGVASLALLPCFAVGLVVSRSRCHRPSRRTFKFHSTNAYVVGKACLLSVSLGAMGAGLVILTVGMTAVFVPQDLEFMAVSTAELDALNPRLIPLIAHDRAGFGGALVAAGSAASLCVWFGRPTRSLWQALTLAGMAGFGPAIWVHFAIGYTDPLHLSPALAGAAIYAAGLALTYRPMVRGSTSPDNEPRGLYD